MSTCAWRRLRTGRGGAWARGGEAAVREVATLKSVSSRQLGINRYQQRYCCCCCFFFAVIVDDDYAAAAVVVVVDVTKVTPHTHQVETTNSEQRKDKNGFAATMKFEKLGSAYHGRSQTGAKII